MPARNSYRVRAVTPDDWPQMEALFGPRGACGGCWCMYWRMPKGVEWSSVKYAGNRRAFQSLVRSGRVHGCLAFLGEDAVGWVCLGPRDDFPRLQRARSIVTEAGLQDWAVVCFYIPAAHRGRGVARALLQGAVSVARGHGVRVLEGYPVRLTEGADGPKRYPATFAYVGVPSLFEGAGFRRVSDDGAARPVYRKALRPTRHA